jgi:hypothetical protein
MTELLSDDSTLLAEQRSSIDCTALRRRMLAAAATLRAHGDAVWAAEQEQKLAFALHALSVLRAQFACHAAALGRMDYGSTPPNPPWIPAGGASLSALAPGSGAGWGSGSSSGGGDSHRGEHADAAAAGAARVARCKYASAVVAARRAVLDPLPFAPPASSRAVLPNSCGVRRDERQDQTTHYGGW